MKKLIIVASLVAAFASCGKKTEVSLETSDSGGSLSAESYPSTSETSTKIEVDSSRKFVRTANLKFKVKDVEKSTYEIEQIVRKYRGFITHTELRSDILQTNRTEISKDSVLETKLFEVRNHLAIRIPNQSLDTTLQLIGAKSEFLESRQIEAEDVALQLKSKELALVRIKAHEKRLSSAIDYRGKKLGETNISENHLLEKIEEHDNAYIESRALLDQVNYSTVNVEIYQTESVLSSVLPNTNFINDLKPSFGYRFGLAFQTGISIISEIVLILVRLWAILLLIVAGFLIYKSFKHRPIKVVS